ncbi:MAG: ABC transporter substrate-binding protein [Gammaproteobacteria bacterium]
MMLKRFFVPILFGFMVTLTSTVFAVGNATESVRMSVEAIVGILKDAGLDQPAKREKIRVVIAERFDFRAMSQRTLATNWKKASKEEQQQFVGLFAELIQNTYIGRVEAYTNEEVKYPGEKITNDRAVVDTLIITSSKEIPVTYRLYLKGDRWLVYDVNIEGVSLISNYRNSYQEIVKREGFAGLLAKMEEKVKELANQPS